MSVSSIGSTPTIKVPETMEPKGPDVKNDGDADDGGASKAVTQAAVPAGQGQYVNKTA